MHAVDDDPTTMAHSCGVERVTETDCNERLSTRRTHTHTNTDVTLVVLVLDCTLYSIMQAPTLSARLLDLLDRLLCNDDFCVDLSKLDLPDGATYRQALQTAVHDCGQALQSWLQLAVLTTRPILLGVYYVASTLLQLVYKYILVQGLYEHGLSQVQAWSLHVIRFQRSLTYEQYAYEGVGLLALIGLYKLQRRLRRYLPRVRLWCRRTQRRVKKTYQTTLSRIAALSYGLAVLTPHLMFCGVYITLVSLLPPSHAFVNQAWTFGLLLYPLVSTVLVLQSSCTTTTQQQQGEVVAEYSTKSSRGKRTKTKRQLVAAATGLAESRDARRDDNDPLTTTSSVLVQMDLDYWLDYWMIVVALQMILGVVSAMPLLGRLLLSSKYDNVLRLGLVVWIHLVPYLSLDRERPLASFSKSIGRFASNVQDKLSSAVPESTWENSILRACSPFFSLAVTLRLISQETSEWMLVALREVRKVIVACVGLFVPFCGYTMIFYTRSILPLAASAALTRSNDSVSAQSSTRSSRSMLRYYVLHQILGALLYRFSSLLWWIPLSNHVVFFVWWYLLLPASITKWYTFLVEELQYFGLLQAENAPTESRVSRAARWVLSCLPSGLDKTVGVEPSDETRNKVTGKNRGSKASQQDDRDGDGVDDNDVSDESEDLGAHSFEEIAASDALVDE